MTIAADCDVKPQIKHTNKQIMISSVYSIVLTDLLYYTNSTEEIQMFFTGFDKQKFQVKL